MKIKTSELKDAALDWAVAKCEGDELAMARIRYPEQMKHLNAVAPSKYWDQGGPIIEREGICLHRYKDGSEWSATYSAQDPESFGPTPLIAAMRCYVASKLGDEVEVPDELSTAP